MSVMSGSKAKETSVRAKVARSNSADERISTKEKVLENAQKDLEVSHTRCGAGKGDTKREGQGYEERGLRVWMSLE